MQPPRQSVSEVISRFQRSSSRAISGTNHSEGLDRYFGKRSYEEVHEEEGKSAPLREVTNAPHSERTRSDYADPDSYWTRRSKKLRQQAATAKYSLFSSIYVYIDGSTGRICYYTLVKLIQRYGGTVLSMPSKTKCTHILAKTLNAGKVQENIKSGCKLPVVDPEWIIACIKAKTLLPVHQYLTVRDPSIKELNMETETS